MPVDVAPTIPAPVAETSGAASAELTAALLDVANRLDVLATQRAGLARAARVEWSGPHRMHFDVERANRDAQTAALAAWCRRLAHSQR